MKVILTALLFFFSCTLFAQQISKVTLNSSGATEMITIQTNDAVINLSLDGNIVNYGVEYASERIAGYTRVEKYTGRTDMFGDNDDVSFRGKLKYLGQTAVTYYASYDDDLLKGKVKTIGGLNFDYFRQYDDEALRGKIKSIGNSNLDYYTGFDNAALKGKLKTIGLTQITYYSSFDDKAYAGKIKSIGSTPFTYYASYDSRYAGAMKTGTQMQNLNGITFYIKW